MLTKHAPGLLKSQNHAVCSIKLYFTYIKNPLHTSPFINAPFELARLWKPPLPYQENWKASRNVFTGRTKSSQFGL